jgi:lysozyme family protein
LQGDSLKGEDAMQIDGLINAVIGREGGYTNHPADKGGPTRWGVTEAVARAHGWQGEMRSFPREEAVSIYRKLYWQRPGFDRISSLAPQIAAEMFDTGINMGPATAIGFLKRALNALNRDAADYGDIDTAPVIDDATIAALTGFLAKRGTGGEGVLLKALEALQGERNVRLAETRPANEAFLFGWLSRRVALAA